MTTEFYPPTELFSVAFATVILIVLLATGQSLRGTTLGAARWWSIGSVACLLFVELLLWKSDQPDGYRDTLRYIVGITTFCPMMAVLGAKRPQHTAWQMIVLSLWIILALPAAEAFFVRRGATVQIHDARGWFLWVLIGVGCLNYLGTRHGLAALIAAVGQIAMLGEHLPLWRHLGGSRQTAVGMAILLIATLLVVWRSVTKHQGESVNDLWLEFRDRFGTFWSFRVAERFNAQALTSGWSRRLGHFGLSRNATLINADAEQIPHDANELLASMLSRFESDRVIANLRQTNRLK